MKRFLLAALLLTVGCSTPPVADLRGEWGGEHVSLTITDAGSSLLFDCAVGTIPGPFTVDAQGRFDLSGTFTPGTGGPEPITPRPAQGATYSGRVSGQSMSLTVAIDGDLPAFSYELKQGEPPQLFLCL
jgi:hypothetical protein